MSDSTKPLSALQDNILKKGANAYYYAHAPKDMLPGIKTTLNDVPRLLETVKASDASEIIIETISKFAWCDEDAKVKIYIDIPEGLSITSNDIESSGSGSAVEFKIKTEKKHYVFKRSNLSREIKDVKVRVGTKQCVISLIKESSTPWYTLCSE